MKLERGEGKVVIRLDAPEVELLRHTLERALFIDTAPQEQESIASFAARLLDALSAKA